MGCGCQGTSPTLLPRGGTRAAAAAPSTGTYWEVTYPNSVVVPFSMQWQAHQAAALSGGTIRTVRAGQPDTPDGASERPPSDPG